MTYIWTSQARALVAHLEDAIFTLDHDAHYATVKERVHNFGTHSEPFLGITAKVEPWSENPSDADLIGRDLRLMSHPYNGQTVYQIIAPVVSDFDQVRR